MLNLKRIHLIANRQSVYLLDCISSEILYEPFLIQGDPNQNLKFILGLTLKVSISDPGLVKPKCV